MAPIHIDTLLFPFQALDVIGPLDLLNSADAQHLAAMKDLRPRRRRRHRPRPPSFVFHHIAPSLDAAQAVSSGALLVPTDALDDCLALDCLLVGGSGAQYELSPHWADFVRRHVAAGRLLF